MYSAPNASSTSTRYRRSSASVIEQALSNVLSDALFRPVGVNEGEIGGETIPRQLPRLVSQPQSLHARKRTERPDNFRVLRLQRIHVGYSTSRRRSTSARPSMNSPIFRPSALK